jgi:hypothetical protein
MIVDAIGLSNAPTPRQRQAYWQAAGPHAQDGQPEQDAQPKDLASAKGVAPAKDLARAAPAAALPGRAATLPIAESALRHVLASLGSSGGSNDPAATALELLRSVEELLRAASPEGTSAQDLGAAAAQLVERQGLLARLSASTSNPVSQPGADAWSGSATGDADPAAVDTRL